ncbi:ataxin-2 homolog [Parasteatoda tepidariorum]|uniref:ataxin-2 homolog n=1 Tax=Parasteatoda tepidariorum TaxID=114398 RepID=UPI001C71C307|nr:uncharacterized protein LOC107437966 [Parasteatoda tepidariorum]
MVFRIPLFAALVAVCFCNAPDTFRIDGKQSLEEYKSPPSPYNFEFNTKDENGTSQFRSETSDGKGKIEGRYGYKDAFGIERIVEYVADENGYRAQIKTNEPGIESKSPASAQFYTNPLPSTYRAAQASKSFVAPATSSIQQQSFTAHGSQQEFATVHKAQESHVMKQHHDFKRLGAETAITKDTSSMKAADTKKPTASSAFFTLGATEEKKKFHFADKEHKQTSAPQSVAHFVQQTASTPLSHTSPAESSFVQFASAQMSKSQQQFRSPLDRSSSAHPQQQFQSSFVQQTPAQSPQPQQQFKGTSGPHYFSQSGSQPLVFFLAHQGQQVVSQSGPQKGQFEGAQQPQFRFHTGFVQQPNAPFTIFQQ